MQGKPPGWPGITWIEGKTVLQIPDIEGQAEWRVGPANKSDSPVFHNVAMANNRTRSVLLLGLAIKNKWLLKEGKLRVLDGLAASSLRSRRWLNELPVELAEQLEIISVDRNDESVAWALANHEKHPPKNSNPEQLSIQNGDLRQIVYSGGWQWIDIDPYGSPIPFLDSAMQNLARKAILQVSATDTAALCGTYPQVTRRRYAAYAVNDSVTHDTAMRILLGNIALCAARHERSIEPLISVFDGHHTRVSVLVTPGKKNASNVYNNLGWRVNEPDKKTISAAIKAGLHNLGCANIPQPRVFLPYNSPPESLANGKVSGPLWIGPLAREDVLEQLTEEYALEICGISKEKDENIISLTGWNDEDIEKSNRGVVRSIKKLYESKDAVGIKGLVTMDELPQWTDIGGPPSPKKLVSKLKERGFKASISVISTPAIQTNAPWNELIEIVKNLAKQ
ncbi:MAG: hypothetical protein CL983_04190 [Euryarchaeota archaeon]|nr:hypothetical protein [Euryarchaeota archaeon]